MPPKEKPAPPRRRRSCLHLRRAPPEDRREAHPTLLGRGGFSCRRLGGRRLGGRRLGGRRLSGRRLCSRRLCRGRFRSRRCRGRRLSRGRLCSRRFRRRRCSCGRLGSRRCRSRRLSGCRWLRGWWRFCPTLRREVINYAENDDRDDDVQNCTATTAAARRPSVTHLRPPMVGYVPRTQRQRTAVLTRSG